MYKKQSQLRQLRQLRQRRQLVHKVNQDNKDNTSKDRRTNSQLRMYIVFCRCVISVVSLPRAREREQRRFQRLHGDVAGCWSSVISLPGSSLRALALTLTISVI